MNGKESRHCPHFDTHNGVCGCPEFWQPAQHSQTDRPLSTLREGSNTRYGRSALSSQISSSVNSIPLPDRTKIQLSTPAPPGPPKETCFFWYHGACRRGDECDRPHEAHPTWPIPPPPGYRHFQPCTLPLCPLRTDVEAATRPQEHQRHRRIMGGQMDGAAFSRATTAGESSSDNDSNTNINTDMSEAGEGTSMMANYDILGVSVRHGITSQAPTGNAGEEGTGQEGEVKVQQGPGRSEYDESDYVDLSQLLSPPSTPLVQEETLLSISHSGTLSKRPTTHSPKSNNKRVKLEEGSSLDLSNVVSILERPRNMSQWDIKPPNLCLDGQHSEPGAAYFALTHSFPPQPESVLAANDSPMAFAPQPFDPPKGPRSMITIPPICFFYYHKGYCKTKTGRRCDYLHNMSTSQQTVSLPHGIDNHDPTCSLSLCPVRLRSLVQVKQEPKSFASSMQSKIKYEPATPPRINRSTFFEVPDSSPRDEIIAVRDRTPKGMLGQPLPQLTGVTRRRFKEQKRRIEQIQAENSIVPTDVGAAIDAGDRAIRKKTHRGKKAGRKLAERLRRQQEREEKEPIRQGLNGHSDALRMQRPLPALFVKEKTPTLAIPPLVGIPNKKRRKNRSKKPLHGQHVEELWLGDSIKAEGIRGFTPDAVQGSNPSWALQGFPSSPQAPNPSVVYGEKQVSIGSAFEMVDAMNRGPRKWRPLMTNPQRVPFGMSALYEHSQESLGLSSADRRAETHKEQRASCEAFIQGQRAEQEKKAHLAASVVSPDSFHQPSAGDKELGPKPRCQRCREMRKGCDPQGPCQRCNDTDCGVEGCVDWDGNNSRYERYEENVEGTDSAAGYQLPEGDQRLDWSTDLVRRLFSEIE